MVLQRWIVIALVACLPLALVSCEKQDEPAAPTGDEMKETGKDVGKELKDTAEAMKHEASEAAEKVKESVKETAEKAGQGMQDAADKIKSAAQEKVNEMAVKVGNAVPTFKLADQSGQVVNLADMKGKIVVLQWTNPECPFIKRHLEEGTMNELVEEYGDKGVMFAAVNSTNWWTVEKNKAFHDEQKLTYPVLDDHNGAVGQMFGAKTTPHVFIIDKSGKLVYNGAIDDDPKDEKVLDKTNYVAMVLDELLAGKEPSITETKPYGCSVKYGK